MNEPPQLHGSARITGSVTVDVVVERETVGGEPEPLDHGAAIALRRSAVTEAVVVDSARLDDELVAREAPDRETERRGAGQSRGR